MRSPAACSDRACEHSPMSAAARIGPPIATSQYGPGNPIRAMSNGRLAAPALQSSLMPLESGGHRASATHSTDWDTEHTLLQFVIAASRSFCSIVLIFVVLPGFGHAPTTSPDRSSLRQRDSSLATVAASFVDILPSLLRHFCSTPLGSS